MKDRKNRDVDEPLDTRKEADPSMKEKDTSEERQYEDKAGENTPEPRKSDE